MESAWLKRLRTAIEADGRSLRRISTEAGRGPNFLQQMLDAEDGKTPSIENFMRILAVIGEHSAFYVLTGQAITPEDFEFLRLSRRLDKKARDAAIPLLEALPHREDNQEQ